MLFSVLLALSKKNFKNFQETTEKCLTNLKKFFKKVLTSFGSCGIMNTKNDAGHRKEYKSRKEYLKNTRNELPNIIREIG